jgi:two-component system, NtrC family, sensor histidine kinase HydH
LALARKMGLSKDAWWKIALLGAIIVITVSIHYGFILMQIFGHSEWVHAIHSRLCYIPIVMAAAWFGLRGGLASAAIISLAIQPYIFFSTSPHLEPSSEWVEIIFYFAIGALIGLLVDREKRIRGDQAETMLELERSRRLSLMGQMAASVAHEIKNPLASIKGAVEIINSPATSADERREFEGIVASEIGRIDRTVREFLDFGRPRDIVFHRTDLSAVVTSAAKQMERQISERGLELVTMIENDIMAEVDGESIHQLALNLLLNAIDASTDGSAIEVRLEATADDSARLSVSDQGEGIGEEEIDRIFEPFFTTKSTGTGLGLAVAHTIVARHAGKIEVASTPDRGTTLSITIPLKRTGGSP